MRTEKTIFLVVEDDEITNFMTSIMFEDWNHDCQLEFALDVEDAIEYLANPKKPVPDYILLDVNLGKLTGWDFLDLYQQSEMDQHTSSRIFMLSAIFYDDDKKKMNSYGFVDGFQEKPLTLEAISKMTEMSS